MSSRSITSEIDKVQVFFNEYVENTRSKSYHVIFYDSNRTQPIYPHIFRD
jgi:hypothetical protein